MNYYVLNTGAVMDEMTDTSNMLVTGILINSWYKITLLLNKAEMYLTHNKLCGHKFGRHCLSIGFPV